MNLWDNLRDWADNSPSPLSEGGRNGKKGRAIKCTFFISGDAAGRSQGLHPLITERRLYLRKLDQRGDAIVGGFYSRLPDAP